MDMKKKKPSSHLQSSGKRRKKGDTDQLAAQLAPLEEQDKQAAAEQIGEVLNTTSGKSDRNYGAIVVDNENLKVPTDIAEEQDEKRFLGIEPVVLVVLLLSLSFIAFVAWQITLMSPK
jgi:hypothetical protein